MRNVTFNLGHAEFWQEKIHLKLRSQALIDIETMNELLQQKVSLGACPFDISNVWITNYPVLEFSFDILLRKVSSALMNNIDWTIICRSLSSALTGARLWNQLNLICIYHTNIVKELSDIAAHFLIVLRLKVKSPKKESQIDLHPLRSNLENLQCPSSIPAANLRKIWLLLEFFVPASDSTANSICIERAYNQIPLGTDIPPVNTRTSSMPLLALEYNSRPQGAVSGIGPIQRLRPISIIDVQSAMLALTDAALRSCICKKTPRLLTGIRAIGSSYQTTLQEVIPVLFLPEYAVALTQHISAIPTLTRTLQRCLSRSNTTYLPPSRANSVAGSSLMPDTIDAQMVGETIGNVLHTNLWLSMAHNVRKLNHTRSLKPLSKSGPDTHANETVSAREHPEFPLVWVHKCSDTIDQTIRPQERVDTIISGTKDGLSDDLDLIHFSTNDNLSNRDERRTATREDSLMDCDIFDLHEEFSTMSDRLEVLSDKVFSGQETLDPEPMLDIPDQSSWSAGPLPMPSAAVSDISSIDAAPLDLTDSSGLLLQDTYCHSVAPADLDGILSLQQTQNFNFTPSSNLSDSMMIENTELNCDDILELPVIFDTRNYLPSTKHIEARVCQQQNLYKTSLDKSFLQEDISFCSKEVTSTDGDRRVFVGTIKMDLGSPLDDLEDDQMLQHLGNQDPQDCVIDTDRPWKSTNVYEQYPDIEFDSLGLQALDVPLELHTAYSSEGDFRAGAQWSELFVNQDAKDSSFPGADYRQVLSQCRASRPNSPSIDQRDRHDLQPAESFPETVTCGPIKPRHKEETFDIRNKAIAARFTEISHGDILVNYNTKRSLSVTNSGDEMLF